MPWLDYLFIKNPLRQLLSGGSTGAIAHFARERMRERLQSPQNSDEMRMDLSRFLEAKGRSSGVVDDA